MAHSALVHNRFKLLKKCGSGGTGEVYQALDTRLKRVVALKRVRASTAPERQEKAARLLLEAENLARIDHPNVVVLHDVIEGETSVSIVMEFVKGAPFKELIQRRPLPEAELLGYLVQILDALEAVHAAGILHRDINPRNVLVTPSRTVKLTDFGLSSPIHLQEHRAGGTIGYMAPEALRRKHRLGCGVDIYGAGLLSYEALLGGTEFQRLYGAQKPIDWARWLLSRERFRTLLDVGAKVSGGLAAIVDKMLEKEPKERYQRIGEVRKDLKQLAAQALPIEPAGPSLVAGMRRLFLDRGG